MDEGEGKGNSKERRSNTADNRDRQTRLNEKLTSEARNIDLARRRAEHTISEKQAELNEARKREQSLIYEGRRVVMEQNQQLKEAQDKLNNERESATAIVDETERINTLANEVVCEQ